MSERPRTPIHVPRCNDLCSGDMHLILHSNIGIGEQITEVRSLTDHCVCSEYGHLCDYGGDHDE